MSQPNPKDELVAALPALRGYAINLTRNRSLADDMIQDTLVKAWSNIEKFKPGTNMRAWLFTILRNTYYTNRRKANREVADVDEVFASQLSVKPDHDGRMQFADFKSAFGTLLDEQREVLVLVGALGFSYDEAAETCGIAVGTVKSRVNRARKRLLELLDMDDETELEMTDQSTMSVLTASPGSIS
jgi:RNA polymerase sigma-70 factor (ECF subfamily)